MNTVNTVEHSEVVGNTKTTTKRTRGWCFTLNNYTEEEYEKLKTFGHTNTDKFVIGKEVGKSGTPHLQGYMYFKNAQRFERMKQLCANAHWERSKGSAEQNLKYCSKDGVYEEKGCVKKKTQQELIKEEMLEEYNNTEWRPWQKKVMEIVENNNNDRKINWIYDPVGNNGKSYLRRYLCLTNEAILADGKKDNIFNAFKVKCIDEDKRVNLCVMDIPRQNERFVNYGTIEAIVDRHLYSGKYEGGEIFLPKMNIIIFSNFYPDTESMTEDRWNIINIEM